MLAELTMIEALVEHWDRVNSALDDTDRALLHGLIERLADAAGPARESLREQIGKLLFAKLPHDDPVVVIGHRYAEPAGDVAGVLDATVRLRLKLTDRAPWPAHRRILATPCDSASSMRRNGVDPDVPDLIRLDRGDGSVGVPLFQLDEVGRPADFVLRVNRILGAQTDPWGVTDWWLRTNVWLHEPPVLLLSSPGRDLVMTAALAAVEG